MCESEILDTIDKLIERCTMNIQTLSNFETFDIINNIQSETEPVLDVQYNDLLHDVILYMIKTGKTEIAGKLTGLSKDSNNTKEVYERTRNLLVEIKEAKDINPII